MTSQGQYAGYESEEAWASDDPHGYRQWVAACTRAEEIIPGVYGFLSDAEAERRRSRHPDYPRGYMLAAGDRVGLHHSPEREGTIIGHLGGHEVNGHWLGVPVYRVRLDDGREVWLDNRAVTITAIPGQCETPVPISGE